MNEAYLKQNILKAAEIHCHTVTDSTNTEAKGLYHGSPLLITAEAQTAGRGRRGRSFYSPAETGLYMSVAFPVAEQNLVFLTGAAAVVVCRALQQTAGIEAQIKWVNDVLYRGRKIAGILCERVADGVIIGVGVNIETTDFPADIAETAGSIGKTIDKEALCIAIAEGLFTLTEGATDCLAEYRERLMLTGKEIAFEQNGVTRYGTVTGIDDRGGLQVVTKDGTVTLSSGEITVRVNGGECRQGARDRLCRANEVSGAPNDVDTPFRTMI